MELVYDARAARGLPAAHRRPRRLGDLPRPLPRERDRGRRRRDLRRRGRLDRRRDAARRGGGDPLGRLCLRAPAALARRRDAARDPEATTALALELGVVGLMNVQYGVLGDELYVIEANPRASRTVPFVSKATGLPLAKIACRVMLGERLADMELPEDGGWDGRTRLGQGGGAPVRPVRRGGRAARAGDALHRRGDGRRRRLPDRVRQGAGGRGREPAAARHGVPHGDGFRQARDQRDRRAAADLGFSIVATGGTAGAIARMGIPVERLNKIQEGSPHVVDRIERGDVDLVINTPTGTAAPGTATRSGGRRSHAGCRASRRSPGAWRRRGRSRRERRRLGGALAAGAPRGGQAPCESLRGARVVVDTDPTA